MIHFFLLVILTDILNKMNTSFLLTTKILFIRWLCLQYERRSKLNSALAVLPKRHDNSLLKTSQLSQNKDNSKLLLLLLILN